jgi:hypothetical protein
MTEYGRLTLTKSGRNTFSVDSGAIPKLYSFDKQKALKIQSVIESGDFLVNSRTPFWLVKIKIDKLIFSIYLFYLFI